VRDGGIGADGDRDLAQLMAIYRPRRSSWPAAMLFVAVGALIGFGIGFALFGSRPVDLADAAERMAAPLTEARGLVEVAGIEYREAVRDGAVVAETEFQGATGALARAEAAYQSVSGPLARVAPARAEAIDAGFAGLHDLFDSLAPPEEVDSAVDALVGELVSPTAD
jgi:hypothetical protein